MVKPPTPFVDFDNAKFSFCEGRTEYALPQSTLLGSLVFRPTLCSRHQIRWIAACAWRSRLKTRGLAAFKQAKEMLDESVITEAANSITRLIREIFGERPVDAITCIPCGHSRRPDCFGKRLAQSVASYLDLPFMQIFADRPCPGTSHPRQSLRLPPLQLIAHPPRSMILVDDLATSGWHLEEAMLALRRLNVAVASVVWISRSTSQEVLRTPLTADRPWTQRPPPFVLLPRSSALWPYFETQN